MRNSIALPRIRTKARNKPPRPPWFKLALGLAIFEAFIVGWCIFFIDSGPYMIFWAASAGSLFAGYYKLVTKDWGENPPAFMPPMDANLFKAGMGFWVMGVLLLVTSGLY